MAGMKRQKDMIPEDEAPRWGGGNLALPLFKGAY